MLEELYNNLLIIWCVVPIVLSFVAAAVLAVILTKQSAKGQKPPIKRKYKAVDKNEINDLKF